MKLEILKCPSCGANIEFEEGAEYCECEYCGAKITVAPTKDTTPLTNDSQKTARTFTAKNKSSKTPSDEGVLGKAIRKVFNGLFIACLFMTGFAVIMLFTDMDAMGFGIVAFFAIYTVMFRVLALTPKKSQHILGKSRGIKPVYFVVICILLSFTVIMMCAEPSEDTNTTDNTSNTSITANVSVD